MEVPRFRFLVRVCRVMGPRTLERAKKGESEALRVVVQTHQSSVFGLLSRLVGPSDAEDLAQETFLKAFVALPRFDRSEDALRPWLLTIATRTGIDALRKRARVTPLPDKDLVGSEPSPERALFNSILAKRLHDALMEESAGSRAAFLLHAFHGMSDVEIGGVLECKAASIRSRIHRTKNRLRHRLRDLEPSTSLLGQLT